ncbi:hypothetical protein P3W85_24440 [Cupriavidus basilensis]|uniref:Uncharacterized protein n=1 Tax=Cupriavidus basilensis TaxID=68895 RepID=A0ABT6ATX2_9BURK|nr:hypothetical protein [Cupriavidus basilensis]MDF3836076.1 hypothetical protein [Cupriavidus basilensis]
MATDNVGEYWVLDMAFGEDPDRMRYYTNVPAWKTTVPKTIRA